MLVDCYTPEDVFARVPEVAQQADRVLKELDRLLEDDQLYRQVRADLGKRYRLTLVHGRYSMSVEVSLRMLLCKHLYGWSYEQTRERVADSLVLRWFCRVYFQEVPTRALCWLLRISVPKKSAHDGSTSSFSWQSMHQISGVKVSYTTVYFLILERIS